MLLKRETFPRSTFIIYENIREDYLMGNYRFHTPDGVIDILPQDASAKRKIETDIRELFSGYGYSEVETPGIEYYDVYASGDYVSTEDMFKMTDMDGRWSVEGMEAGEYFLKAEFPEGYVPVEPGDVRLTEGGQVSLMETIHGRTGESGAITLRMGTDLLDLNVGSVAPGSLGDLVWLDENGDGLQDSGDGGIPGVTVHLWRNGEEIASTVTDQYGFYRFEDLYPGVYTLTADVTGLMPTVQRTDIPGIVSVTGETESLPVQVTSDSHNYNADLGYVLTIPGAYPEGYGQGATQQWQ